MPRSSILFAALALWHCSGQTQARVLQRSAPAIIDGHGASLCAVELGGYEYDLCPLWQRQVRVDGSWATTIKAFDGDKGEGTSRGKTVSSIECNHDTWICLPDTSRRQVFVKATEVSLTMPESDSISPALHLHLQDDNLNHLEIVLICEDDESFLRHPSDTNMSRFVWATRRACPTSLPRVSILEDTPTEGGSEDDGNEDKELAPASENGRMRKLMPFAIVFVGLLAIIYIAFSSPKTREYTIDKFRSVSPLLSRAVLTLRPVGSTVKGLASKSSTAVTRKIGSRFRQDDHSLVRWAQEDFAIADVEDVMVNGSGAYTPNGSWNAEGLDEYIPLNLEPRHGARRSVKSYGATPDVATFAERRDRLLGNIGSYFRK